MFRKWLSVILVAFVMVVVFGPVGNSCPNQFMSNSPPSCANESFVTAAIVADQNYSPPALLNNVLAVNSVTDVKFVSASPLTLITDESVSAYAMVTQNLRPSESPPTALSTFAGIMVPGKAWIELTEYVYIGDKYSFTKQVEKKDIFGGSDYSSG
ncbi:MAG: hypothetical protein V1668_04785 [Patescibacteria group bacterium]